jgi:hypothetical protein
MPLPLGHAVIGLATHDLLTKEGSAFTGWKTAVYVTILANLPDLDVVIGLLFAGNGNAFHRGPSHSIVFALVMGYLASKAWKLYAPIPKMTFTVSSLLILSHVVADLFFTQSSVSLLWPLEVSWSGGHSGWMDVISAALLEQHQDVRIIMICGGLILLNQFIRRRSDRPKSLLARWRFFGEEK